VAWGRRGDRRAAAARGRPGGPWLLALLLGVLLAACGRTASPPPQPLPAPPAAPVPAPVVRADNQERLCLGLRQVVAAWPDAFASLRGPPTGPSGWQAPPLDDAFARCRIEGSGLLTASHACLARPGGVALRAVAAAGFQATGARIDRCLGEPDSAGARRWVKAGTVELAGGERQVLWHDAAAWPRPAVQLKLEEDYDQPGAWRLRLATYTMR
jgi:hypothetical protein